MKFYLDFEATQFSQRIISIGCVAENGDTFATLVKPYKDKVTDFITTLTGITNEMIANAPGADEAFGQFYDWVLNINDDNAPEYFCYGDSDKTFLDRTISHMKDTKAMIFVSSIKGMLTDYSTIVRDYFNAGQISLQRIFALVHGEETVQHHDALEDAKMLREVAENMFIKCTAEDATKLPSRQPKLTPSGNSKHAPEIFIQWPHKKFDADTLADESNYQVKCYNKSGDRKYFDTIDTAALWAIKYLIKNRSPKKQGDIDAVVNGIIRANGKRIAFGDFYWEIKDGHAM